MYRIAVLLLLFLLLHRSIESKPAHKATRNCATLIKEKCGVMTACSELLNKLYFNCTVLLSGSTHDKYSCTPDCQRTIQHLRNHPIGRELMECECKDDWKCKAYSNRLRRCVDGTPISKKHSCSKLTKRCLRKQPCNEHYSSYLKNCGRLFNGYQDGCTAECLASAKSFSRFKLGKKTIGEKRKHCKCDGTIESEISCYEEKQNWKDICKNPTSPLT